MGQGRLSPVIGYNLLIPNGVQASRSISSAAAISAAANSRAAPASNAPSWQE